MTQGAGVCAWDQPAAPLAPGVWCGTTLCLPTSPAQPSSTPSNPPSGPFSTYGAFNLATHVGDQPAAVAKNRQRLQAYLQADSIQWLDQVHGCAVVEATASSTAQVPTADAVWTQEPRLPIAALTADCLPVVLAARDGSCVGVAHGGWRGLVAGVLPALVAAMPVAAEQMVAWGGPGIGVQAYEVGDDVALAVDALAGAKTALLPGRKQGKFQLDLHQLARVSLAASGVVQYEPSARCAFADNACYSYRRSQGEATGRMATIGLLSG